MSERQKQSRSPYKSPSCAHCGAGAGRDANSREMGVPGGMQTAERWGAELGIGSVPRVFVCVCVCVCVREREREREGETETERGALLQPSEVGTG